MTRMTSSARPRRILVDRDADIEAVDQERMVRTNALCPHRSRCLDDACLQNVPHLDCEGCPHISDYDDKRMLFYDVEGCLRLLWTLCGNPSRFDRHEAERLLFDRRDWQEDPVMPGNGLSL